MSLFARPASCERIVEEYGGGEVVIKSQEGVGTTVTIWLPGAFTV